MASIRRSDAYRAVADILDKIGVPHMVEAGGKHAKVRFTLGGREHAIIVSISPSDRRVYDNSRSFTRRYLRQYGVSI